MPNAFLFRSKETGQPTQFIKIDEEICNHLGVPIHETQYYNSWYDIIGLAVAVGRKLNEIANDESYGETTRKIAAYLDSKYTSEAWYAPR
jgi:hypothetical protein